MYCETCAAIALVQFSFELFKLTNEPKYLATMERALYNSVLSGAAIDGKHFFYVNPLEVNPQRDQENPGKGHVKAQRPDWLGCACCPPTCTDGRFAAALGLHLRSREALREFICSKPFRRT